VIDVIASIRVRPGRLDEFLTVFKALVPEVLAEDGCHGYYPAVDIDTGLAAQVKDPDIVTIVEKWRDVDALRAHLEAPHMLSYRERAADLVESVSLTIVEAA
jgi:quinol monooxygenase YgiN